MQRSGNEHLGTCKHATPPASTPVPAILTQMSSSVGGTFPLCLFQPFKWPKWWTESASKGNIEPKQCVFWGNWTSLPLQQPHSSPWPPARGAHLDRPHTSSLRLPWGYSKGDIWPGSLNKFYQALKFHRTPLFSCKRPAQLSVWNYYADILYYNLNVLHFYIYICVI